MELQNFENNLFKAVLVGVLVVGISFIVPGKNEAQANIASAQTTTLAMSNQSIPQVIIVGKRLHKDSVQLANR